MWKRFLIIVLTITTAAGFGFLPVNEAYAAAGPPEVAADAAVLIDVSTGQVLFDKQKDKQKFPASTTKVMTALLACEKLDFAKTITIDADTPFTKGARVYLLEGEQLTVEQVFMAMMTESANDAAVAVGKEISGSVEKFAELMNQRAKELGAKHTHFVTPNGLHDPEHVSTAYDLALIAREGMRHEEFRTAVSTYRYYIPPTNKQAERYLYNSNRLLYDTNRTVVVNGEKRPIKYDDATGIKTGFTTEAGNCLIAGAKRGDTELIVVLLESGAVYQDAITLMEYGFSNYKSVPVMAAGEKLGDVTVRWGEEKTVAAVTREDIVATLPEGTLDSSIAKKIELSDDITAPVKAGQKVGTVKIYDKTEKLLGEFDLVAKSGVAKGGVLSLFGIPKKIGALLLKIAAAVIGIPLVLIGVAAVLKRRQKRRKQLRRQWRQERLRKKEEEARTIWETELHVTYPGDLLSRSESSEGGAARKERMGAQQISELTTGALVVDRPFTAEKQEKRVEERLERQKTRERRKKSGHRRSRGRVQRAAVEQPHQLLSDEEKLRYVHITKM